MQRDLTAIAIIAAYNEEDIIAQAVGDLVGQDIQVYLLDHGSSDGTARSVERYLGKGLLQIERFPQGSALGGDGNRFALATLIARKQQLARELDADWFINSDADEFRESPWSHLNLRQGIELVDRLGYTAIDFQLLNFWPTHDEFKPGDDVRRAFQHYELGGPWDRVQIRCWKKGPAPVELVSTAGHEAQFDNRKVFPIRFVLRHYPIRSQAHGVRKVFQERRPRFAPEERQRGWHVQYDALTDDHCFIRDASSLQPYDPEAVRVHLQVHHRDCEEQQAEILALRHQLTETGHQVNDLQLAIERTTEQIRALESEGERRQAEIQQLRAALATSTHHEQQLRERLEDAERRLTGVYASRSWRLTAPLRAAQKLTGRR